MPSDGDTAPRKGGFHATRRARSASGGDMTTRRIPVKSVGRNADRYYCPRCGLRHKLCTCTTTTQEES